MQLIRPYGQRAIFILLFILLICIFLRYNSTKFDNLKFFNLRSRDVNTACTDLGPLGGDDPALVNCLVQHYLSPPSNLPYNLTNPEIENPSQFGQTQIVLQLLQFKRNGFFIECGAYDGEIYSNTLYLERKLGWTGLLVEAEAKNYENLAWKHRKGWISHSCLSPKTTAQKLTMVGIEYSAKGGGLTLMTASEPLKAFAGYVNSKRAPAQVQCFPLYTYLLALNITVVDYFSLDIEGADFEILKTIPFDRIIFKVLEVEVPFVNEGKQAVRQFLEVRGYIFMKEIAGDNIFIHNSLQLPLGFMLT